MLLLSCMTGTSYDAFDVAAAEVTLFDDTLTLTPLGLHGAPMASGLRRAVRRVLPPERCGIEDVCRLDADLGRAAGAAVLEAMSALDLRPDAVVWSGQTVHHWVEEGAVRGTLQVGRAAFIAESTGLPVIGDLRARDVACGGQGAPLVCLVDALLLADEADARRSPVAALNLGGIANITVVGPDRPPLAYDVGPANALVDAAAGMVSGGQLGCDVDGNLAARGSVSEALLRRLLDDAYLSQPPPKTTGKERYHAGFLAAACEGLAVSPADLLATVTEHAAETVACEVLRQDVAGLFVAGGGVRNPVLMAALRRRLPAVEVVTTDSLGLPPQGKEALAFAVLGFLTWHGLPANLPSCTGASRAALLGGLTPGREPLRLPAPAPHPPRRLVVAGSS